MLKGTFKLYPKLKAFYDVRKEEDKSKAFEYGYVLKQFPDEQITGRLARPLPYCFMLLLSPTSLSKFYDFNVKRILLTPIIPYILKSQWQNGYRSMSRITATCSQAGCRR